MRFLRRINLLLVALIVASLILAASLYAHFSVGAMPAETAAASASPSSAPYAVTASPVPASSSAPLPTAAVSPGPEVFADDSITRIVNPSYSIPESYVPADLVTPEIDGIRSGITLRKEAADALKEMAAAAEADGVHLTVTEGYRSYREQEQLFNSYVARLGEAQALKSCARAGTSEHQLGLAVDFSDSDTAFNTAFDSTAQGQWLLAHAWEYGFLQRVPAAKASLLGYSVLAWHYRYVGSDLAASIHGIAADETMEEYFGLLR